MYIDFPIISGHADVRFSQLKHLIHMSHNASTIEHLTSLVKQRDGEVNQLQWELSRLQVERDVLNSEISNLSMELENVIKIFILVESSMDFNCRNPHSSLI